MNKPFVVGSDGSVRDSQHAIVGRITASNVEILGTLIFRQNLFDDMLRAIDLLYTYRSADMPEMARLDAKMTLDAAKLA